MQPGIPEQGMPRRSPAGLASSLAIAVLPLAVLASAAFRLATKRLHRARITQTAAALLKAELSLAVAPGAACRDHGAVQKGR